MWTDLRKSASWLLGRGPRRISMDPNYEAERLRSARLARLLVLLGILLVIAAIFGLPSLWRGFKGWRAQGLATQAMAAIERREYTEASRRLSDAVGLARTHPNVLLAQARLASATGQANAVAAWERVLEQQPGEGAHWLDLALALFREERFGEASRAMEKTGAARTTARGNWVAGALAAQRGEKMRAETLLRESLRAGLPEPAEAQLTLASLLIGGPKNAEARTMLEALRPDPLWGRRAAGLLVEQARKAGEMPRAFQLARELAKAPTAQPEDYARLVDLLVAAEDWTGLEELLEKTLPVARKDRKVALAVLEGLLARHRFVQAEGWLADLPVEIWTSAEVAPVAGRIAAREARRETLLRDVVRRGDWSKSESLKQAFSARLAEFEKRDRTRSERWEKARQLASAEARRLRELVHLAADWQWTREHYQAQGALALHPDASPVEVRTWWELARAARDTAGVAHATRLLLDSGDYSMPVKTEYVRTVLLLGQDLDRAHQFARELFATESANAGVVAVFARSLRLQSRPAEALEAIVAAADRQLADPLLQLERAASLSANGQKDAARLVAAGAPSADWFPEEAALWKRCAAP